jgi:zinc/manganese transport system ATP-binding protein
LSGSGWSRWRTIDELSGGQFQRMLFARVLVQQAPLVMLDEPFTGVDEATCNVLMDADAGDV